MATQEQRREATRASLVEAARTLFCRDGIPGTTTRAILAEAGISRGAMYHHFASIEDLIAAVYEAEAAGAIERALARRTPNDSPMEDLLSTCLAWLDEAAAPDVARMLAIEGPAALGWQRCRDIEAAYSLGQMRAWLEAAEREGEIEVASADLVAHILNATLTEAALSIVRSKRKRRARADAETTLRQLVAGLRSQSS